MGWAVVVKLLLLWVFIVLLVENRNHGVEGCVEGERIGLLQLKASFIRNSTNDEISHDLVLPSWVDERESDCCDWERVACNHTTGRVVGLTLHDLRQLGPHYNYVSYDDWPSLNVSLFKPFEELLSLDLSENGFNGSVENEGFERLLKLEILNVAWNHFNNGILKPLGSLTSLKTLNVSNNWMEGSLPVKDYQTLSKLSKLEHLNLSYNNFNKEILKWLANLPVLKFLSLQGNWMEGPLSNNDLISFKNLEVLDLSNNHFTGDLTSLKALSLAWNDLNNTLSIQGLCELKNLQELDLSRNSFEGILPQCLSNLRSLRVLDLSRNQFTGNISFIISTLTSLEYFNLNYNHFEGLFSLSSLANHSNLEILELISSSNNLVVETDDFSNWTPKFQLKILSLSNCSLTGEIPKFLFHQHKLRFLDLSHNHLKGVLPYWLLNNNSRLEFLNMRNNYLTGQFDLPPRLNVSWLDISNNNFTGQLQENISRRLPYISYLNLSTNFFHGILPSSLCNMRYLEKLDLSHNKFSGEVPKELISGCINLSVLKLSSNKFHGQILSTNFNLTHLSELHLDDNQFWGILSNTISKSPHLVVLDISNNYFSGMISSSISNMTLYAVIMRNNSFKGQLPCEVAVDAILDVSHNSLSGSLPSCSYPTHHIYLQANKFTGPIPNAFVNSSSMRTLDISDNSLSGNIPNGISALFHLRVLLLRGNHLSGLNPNQLCKLIKISLLDLSNNYFSGSIPRCISNFSFGPNDHGFFQLGHYISGTKSRLNTPTYGSFLMRTFPLGEYDVFDTPVLAEAEFVTKRSPRSYEGDILNYMSGLDLSCNNLTGEIPHELGELVEIRALNLSHNQLKGSIPRTFSSLTQIESLDLSYNKLSGVIPTELIVLNFLEVFSVAHNNLSGRTPDMKFQFSTFDGSSYEGNPYLCGPQLKKNCTTIVQSPNTPTTISEESEAKWYEIDPEAFYVTFYVSYVMFLLAMASVLAINPYWRRRWFNFIEEHMYSSYYFVSDSFYKLLAH
ncbi:receptor-like protein 14 isoform X2 [Cornus florida]|uniref:receptor-like protein 14 isoform X2 n=1 Tax=Cornus florida TaxID=4283 RepID=UPI0028A19A46|nr:receptor-like protein 14 isoform X2 [Cornus florida]